MNNLWFVKTASGWQVFDFYGNFISNETMMCNCKCHAWRLGVDSKRISDRSSQEEILEYKTITGRDYFDEREERPEDGNYY